MTGETKSEVIIFTGLAAFLGFLWWMNRQSGAGTGLEGLGLPGIDTSGLPSLSAPGPTTFDIGGSNYNVGSSPNGSSSCGCPTCPESNNAIAFGSDADLLKYLSTINLAPEIAATAPGGVY